VWRQKSPSVFSIVTLKTEFGKEASFVRLLSAECAALLPVKSNEIHSSLDRCAIFSSNFSRRAVWALLESDLTLAVMDEPAVPMAIKGFFSPLPVGKTHTHLSSFLPFALE